jgi:hypothetical protein
MIGRFHLGLNYDMLIWLQNSACRVFPCQQEQEVLVKIKNKEGILDSIKEFLGKGK